MVVLVLKRLGIEAVSTVRNDILIGQRKVSGIACYHLADRSIVHGTLLYDTNMEHMLHAITPNPEKLRKKGIESVRQRITLLRDLVTLDIEEVKACIRDTLCEGERQLTADEVAGIERMEEDYLKEEFINIIH